MPETDAVTMYSSTALVTSAVVAPSSTATRAPSRDAFVRICWIITIRPNSIIPKTNRKKRGATTANSTAAGQLLEQLRAPPRDAGSCQRRKRGCWRPGWRQLAVLAGVAAPLLLLAALLSRQPVPQPQPLPEETGQADAGRQPPGRQQVVGPLMGLFRGGPARRGRARGDYARRPRLRWRFPARPMCAPSRVGSREKTWCGTGWTGQPALWRREDGVLEVIFGAFDWAKNHDPETKDKVKNHKLAFVGFALFYLMLPFIGGYTDLLMERMSSLGTKDSSVQSREVVMRQALHAIPDSPFLGHGVFTPEGTFRGGVTMNIHSLYVTLAYKFGIPNLVIFLWFASILFRTSWRLSRDHSVPRDLREFMFALNVALVMFLLDEVKIEFVRSAQSMHVTFFFFALIVSLEQVILNARRRGDTQYGMYPRVL